MRARCAICGRWTEPYAYIGAEPVGPKCAADLGIKPSKAKKGGKVIFVKQDSRRKESPEQPDLFGGVP